MTGDARGCEVVVTRTGARAMRDRATGELMHPVIGPRLEAEHLYVAPSRLAERLHEPGAELVLFEVGLGAGSNAIAAWKLSEARSAPGPRLTVVSFERDLAAFELALADENAEAFGFDGAALEAGRALLARGRHETARTSWRLARGELPATLDAEPPASADVVFWDPFSPRANPSLWTAGVFTSLRARCRDGATVHTYSASTAVRSAMLLAGFAVGVGDATGAKEQTTIAAVDVRDLRRPLDRRWLQRLARSSAPWPVDAPSDAAARVAAMPQFTEGPP